MDESCHVEPIQKMVTVEEQQATALIRLGVQGMGCPNCAALIQAVAQAGNDGRHHYIAFSLSGALA